MELLNTREQAYAIWIILGLICAFVFKGLRKDVSPFFSALVSKSFLKLYVTFLGYNGLAVYFLYWLGSWKISMLKDTLIWLVFAGLPLVYQVARTKQIKIYFQNLLKSLLTFAVVLEFLMSLHTFSLAIELVLAIVMLTLTFTIAFAQAKTGNDKVVNFLQWIVLLVTTGVVLAEYSYLLNYASEFKKDELFWEFWLPAELAVLLIPFLYGVSFYLRFEETFLVIRSPRFSKSIVFYCKILLPYYFLNDPKGLLRWRWAVLKSRPKTWQDLLTSIYQIKELIQEAHDPPEVDACFGWSPYLAKEFMSNRGLLGRDYVNHYEDYWGAVTNRKHLDDMDWLANSVEYFVNGNRYVVTQLKLRLEVFKEAKVADAHAVFSVYASSLFSKISDADIPVEIIVAIMKNTAVSVKLDQWKLIVEKSEYYNNQFGGYSLYFVIEHQNHID